MPVIGGGQNQPDGIRPKLHVLARKKNNRKTKRKEKSEKAAKTCM
jgi:hypothetical protein